MKSEVKGQGKEVRKKVAKVREGMKKGEVWWMRDKERMEGRMKGMERRLKEMGKEKKRITELKEKIKNLEKVRRGEEEGKGRGMEDRLE